MRIGLTHFAAAALLCLPCLASPQASQDVGYLDVFTEQSDWPSPEVVARDLRSADDDTRLKALHLLGLTDQQSHELVWKDGSHSERRVVKPDQIEITYAALGEDADQQAVIAIQYLQSTLAAVATRGAAGWRRIALFSCWCKYDMPVGADALGLFLSFQRRLENSQFTPAHFELVLHGSGGGTGIYSQSEAHYRVHAGRLVSVLSFDSHAWHCDAGIPPPWFCEVERRWFLPKWSGSHGNEPGGVLVEAKTRLAENEFDPALIVELGEGRRPQRISCTPYRWNESTFRFVKSRFLPGEENPCLKKNPASH